MFWFKRFFWLFSIAAMALVSTCTKKSELPSATNLPDIVGVYPGDGSGNIPVGADMRVTFAKTVVPASIIPSGAGGLCVGTIQVSPNDFQGCVDLTNPTSDNGKTYTVKPKSPLDFKTTYKIKIVLLGKDSQDQPVAVQKYETPNGFSTAGNEGPPERGGLGVITVNDLSSDSLSLNWVAASDNSDDASVLAYKIFQSSSDNISTVSQAEANGMRVADWTDNTTDSGKISGLSSGLDYYFNVLVKDSDNNKTAYARAKVRTIDIVPPVVSDGSLRVDDLSSDRITLSWTAASDNSDDTSDLNYKAVRSSSDNINSVSQAESGVLVQDWTPNITSVVATGLSSSTRYYFNRHLS